MSFLDAIETNNVNLFRKLIKKHSKDNLNRLIDLNGSTLLHYAVSSKCDIEMAQTLITSGADINKRNFFKWTPLLHAVMYDELIMVKLLVSKNADVNLPDSMGNTPIMSVKNNKKMLEYLLQNGANINAQNKFGKNAFYYACFGEHYDSIEFLFNQNSKIDLTDLKKPHIIQFVDFLFKQKELYNLWEIE